MDDVRPGPAQMPRHPGRSSGAVPADPCGTAPRAGDPRSRSPAAARESPYSDPPPAVVTRKGSKRERSIRRASARTCRSVPPDSTLGRTYAILTGPIDDGLYPTGERPALQEFEVRFLDRRHHPFQAEPLPRPFPRRPAHRRGPGGIPEQVEDRGRQRRGITGGNEPPGLAVLHGLGDSRRHRRPRRGRLRPSPRGWRWTDLPAPPGGRRGTTRREFRRRPGANRQGGCAAQGRVRGSFAGPVPPRRPPSRRKGIGPRGTPTQRHGRLPPGKGAPCPRGGWRRT